MSKTVAVRWLGAFGDPKHRPHSASKLEENILYELRNPDEVSFAIQEPETQVGGAGIGLLIDTERSSIHKIYAGDAWTIQLDNGNLIATRSREVKGTDRVRDKSWRGYDEAIGRPCYVGVVVHSSANKRERNWARIVAERVGIKYLGTLR